MKTLATLALALLSMSAQATPGGESNNTNCNGRGNKNSPCAAAPIKPPKAPRVDAQPAQQIAAPQVAQPSITNTNSNTGSVSGSYLGGAGGSVSGAGNAYVTSERSAPAVAVSAPQQPLRSCRLGFGIGGSQTGGALGLQFPAGNDAICLVDAQFAIMDRLGGFQPDDYLRAACKVEGMNETSRCKSAPAPAVARVEREAP